MTLDVMTATVLAVCMVMMGGRRSCTSSCQDGGSRRVRGSCPEIVMGWELGHLCVSNREQAVERLLPPRCCRDVSYRLASDRVDEAWPVDRDPPALKFACEQWPVSLLA